MIIYTGGTFDLYHEGHVNLLRRCAYLAGTGGKVIVALNTDEFVERYKGQPPVMTYKEREAVLISSRYVSSVIPNIGEDDSKQTIQTLIDKKSKPDLVVIGSDWHEKDYLKQMKFTWEWLDKNGIGICYFPYTTKISTTAIKKRLCDKQLPSVPPQPATKN